MPVRGGRRRRPRARGPGGARLPQRRLGRRGRGLGALAHRRRDRPRRSGRRPRSWRRGGRAPARVAGTDRRCAATDPRGARRGGMQGRSPRRAGAGGVVTRPAVVAVDGGGSKVDALLLSRTGDVLGAARVPDPKWEDTGDELHMDSIAAALEAAARDAGIDAQIRPIADLGVYCLAGADLPADDRRILRGLGRRGFTTDDVLRNDTFAVLRAGTERDWGVGIVCGFGTNCSGIAPDGRQYRLAAFGAMSGDWGGASEIGQAALWHALRARDGRGPRTSLATSVP